jgi:hypothetical protein
MTGLRIPFANPHRRGGRLLQPFLLAIMLSPLACSSDQPAENTSGGEGSAANTRVHPYLLPADTAVSYNGSAPVAMTKVSANLNVAGVVSNAGPTVLLLADANGPSTTALANSLAEAGFQLTIRPAPEYTWKGTNPALTGYAVVIHLNGATYFKGLPAAGQQALTQFVVNGGGLVGGQWNGYEWAVGQQAVMPDLVLQGWAEAPEESCAFCSMTYRTVPGQQNHSVLAGIPSPFTFEADGHNAGQAVDFETNPSTVLMRTASGDPAVLVRQFGAGKIVNFSFSPNYALAGDGLTLRDQKVQQLYVNAVRWAGGSRRAQTIAFDGLADRVFGDAPFTLGASASSGLPVSFSATGKCAIGETTVTITGAGTCAITASQAGNPAYFPAEDVTRSFSIAKAPATITIVDRKPIFNGAAQAAWAVTEPAGLAGVTLSYSQAGLPVAQPVNAGTYEVAGSLDNPNYAAPVATGTLTIRQATPLIQWTPRTPIFLGTPLAGTELNASATGVGNVALHGGFLYTPPAGTVLGVGAHQLRVEFTPADPNYAGTSKTVQIAVIYRFAGFFRPISNPAVLNQVKAGSTVPVKFSLGGDQGLGILNPGSPTWNAMSCGAGSQANGIVQATTANGNGLSYDAASRQYQYLWKTSSGWSGSCGKLVLTLVDGTSHEALFMFK